MGCTLEARTIGHTKLKGMREKVVYVKNNTFFGYLFEILLIIRRGFAASAAETEIESIKIGGASSRGGLILSVTPGRLDVGCKHPLSSEARYGRTAAKAHICRHDSEIVSNPAVRPFQTRLT